MQQFLRPLVKEMSAVSHEGMRIFDVFLFRVVGVFEQ